MSRFEELLKNALSDMIAAHNRAKDDLYGLITEVNTAILHGAAGLAELKLEILSDEPQETICALHINSKANEVNEENEAQNSTLDYYSIPPNGYPISTGVYTNRGFGVRETFKDKSALEDYFEKLLSQPQSPVL